MGDNVHITVIIHKVKSLNSDDEKALLIGYLSWPHKYS
jgi:hypothetical protein